MFSPALARLMVDYMEVAWDWTGDNAAAITAVCALVVTVYSAHATRRHNRLSVRPHLDLEIVRGLDSTLTVNLTNNGIGPAIIERFDLQLDGTSRDISSQDAIAAWIGPLFLGSRVRWTTFDAGQSVAKDGSFVLIEVRPNMVANAYEILKTADRFRIIIDYRSIYRDLFTLDSGDRLMRQSASGQAIETPVVAT